MMIRSATQVDRYRYSTKLFRDVARATSVCISSRGLATQLCMCFHVLTRPAHTPCETAMEASTGDAKGKPLPSQDAMRLYNSNGES